ncbi:MAG: IgGFc-binding protein [Bradymonadales bacterium]|nr:IgGFc-binding protein [Bradymonadales bacterium]
MPTAARIVLLWACLALGTWGCPGDDPGSSHGGSDRESGTSDLTDIPPRDMPQADQPISDAGGLDGQADQVVNDQGDEGISCTPGEPIGCASSTERLICNEYGTGYTTVPCPGDQGCVDGYCTDEVCTPGESRCVGTEMVEVCHESGSHWNEPTSCPPGTACDNNQCTDLCSISDKIATYIGCEYWAVDLDNDGRPSLEPPYTSAADQQFAVVISNPFDDVVAHITITTGSGDEIALTDPVVPALGLRSFPLPTLNVDGTGLTNRVYRIRSSVPVTAHQFNPENNVYVYSNDASLLLPTNGLGMTYLVLGWPGRYVQSIETIALRAYATIVAVEEGITTVTVRSPVAINAGGSLAALPADTDRNYELQQGQVLNLEMANTDLLDLTGMEITATQQVAVFFGHECSNVPTDTNYCDHLEEQLFPVESWGVQYVGAKSYPRGNEPDVWRILASQDGTTLRTNPAQTGANEVQINRGEFVEFRSSQSFDITATAPILVGQYLVGSNYGPGSIPSQTRCSGSAIGDPAFILNVPTRQYRTDYIVLTPGNYVEDYLTIVAPSGVTVSMDGAALPANCFDSVGWGAYSLCRMAVADGAHVLTAEEPFGLFSYGYDCDVSYGYPGGLDLESLVEENP